MEKVNVNNFQQEQGEHYKSVIEGVQKLFDDKRKLKQEQGEPMAISNPSPKQEEYLSKEKNT